MPEGGQWSFDAENRKKLPKSMQPATVPGTPPTAHVAELIPLVAETFSGHPGSAADFAWPVTRDAALRSLDAFLRERFHHFGPYEDAMTTRSDTATTWRESIPGLMTFNATVRRTGWCC